MRTSLLRKSLLWLPLVFAFLLWLLAAWGSGQENQGRSARGAASLISKDLLARQRQWQGWASRNKELRAWMLGQSALSVTKSLSEQPFFLFAFLGDSLSAWNTVSLEPPDSMSATGRVYAINGGSYYGFSLHKDWMPPGASLRILFPIQRQYPFNNEYLQTGYEASALIDPQLRLSDTALAGASPVFAPQGNPIAWIIPAPSGSLPMPPPGWIVWCWICSIVLLALWLHRWLSLFAQRAGLAWPALLVLALALGIRALLMVYGLPFHISESELFSPRLYASSATLPSLGDLLLHVLALLWPVLFVAQRLHVEGRKWPGWLRWMLSCLGCIGIFAAGFLFLSLVRSLVLDSLIPFDRAHLSSFSGSSLTGILVILLLLIMLLLFVRMLCKGMSELLPALWQRTVAVLVGLGVLWMLSEFVFPDSMGWLVLGWLVLELVSSWASSRKKGFPELKEVFWAMAQCALLCILLLHFTRQRETAARRHFAEHIAARHDDAMEYNFSKIFPQIRTDTALISFLEKPTVKRRKALDERLSSRYLNNVLGAYQAQVYLYDADGRPLINPDSSRLEHFQEIKDRSVPSRTARHLYYREATTNDHLYLALVSITDSSGSPLGTLVADLEQKKIVSETVLPELLQPATVNQAEKAAGYSYAIYSGGRLVAQTSDYPFPFYIGFDSSSQVFRERLGQDASTLIYKPDAYRSVYVWRRFNTWAEVLTLFSVLLLLRFSLLALAWVYRQLRQWDGRFRNPLRALSGMGLRRRLQLSIMGVVAVAFVGIGIVTIIILRQRYDDSQRDRQQAMMQLLTRGLQQWMKEQGADQTPAQWRTLAQSPELSYYLSQLATAQKIDLNLFDAHGYLVSTTQPAIFNQNLLAPVMHYDMLSGFQHKPRSMNTELEQIGTLVYQSCYAPLRLEGGTTAGYLNVPLFYAQRELDEQISGVVVTLINLYAVALLLSALLAYFMSRWMTRAFDIVIRQFGRLSLHQNEPLQWPYDDEMGVLVAEYNKMARKVEESVALLARHERESAFREMARQVAHEIKNPLTPMSLYVQRLERALASHEPDALAMAERVCKSLLEQINNLSVIATEFSEYARMAPSKMERLALGTLIQNVAAPFSAQANLSILFEIPNERVEVMADRSQMVRVLTNLIKNATQAIPEERAGRIVISLSKEARQAIIRVSDNGSGIRPDLQEKLFTPYFTTKSSGTGLGLAMSRQILESWGGSIGFETRVGEGTTFKVCVPFGGEPQEINF
ncbi:MAG: hypothetical protein JST06_06085 [Bacteroidetes bacterium]|nr:hypothetical protein [Bacteroidota bacterium]